MYNYTVNNDYTFAATGCFYADQSYCIQIRSYKLQLLKQLLTILSILL